MPIVCIQCSLQAIVDGREPVHFETTREAHIKEFHPDPEVTQRERRELEEKINAMFERGEL